MHKALTTAWVALKRVWPFRPPSVGGVPIRALCVGLVVACLVPTFVLAALLAQQLAETKRAELQANTERISRELAAVVDRELLGYKHTLEVLAASQDVDQDDLDSFERQLREVASRLKLQIVLRDLAADRQVINTFVPRGTPLPGHPVIAPEAQEEALRTLKPTVSNLVFGPVSKRQIVTVYMPVLKAGRAVYILSISITPDKIRSLFDHVPNGMVDRIVVADATDRAIARYLDHNKWVGAKLAMGDTTNATGSYQGFNSQGMYMFGSYHRLHEAPWVVAATVPQSVVNGPLEDTLIILFAFATCVLALSMYAANRFGSALAASVRQLAHAGVALGRMEPVQRVITPFSEANAVAQELFSASQTIVQTDERKRFAVDAAGIGLYDRDVANGTLYWSPQFKELLGVSEDTEPNDDLLLQLTLPEDRKIIQNVRQSYRTIRNAPDNYEYEWRLAPTEARPMRWLVSKGRVIKDADGKTVRVHGACMDITERKQNEREREDLRRRLMSVQEDERLRLSQDLHDETGQILAASLLELKLVESMSGPDAVARIKQLQKRLEGMGKALHRIAWELRPASLEELGLADAIQNYASAWSREYGIEADVYCEGDLTDLDSEVSTAVYRVLQEALTNVAKHATGATVVSIVLDRSDGQLRVTIEDDGHGFDPADKPAWKGGPSGGLGLAGIRERLSLIGGSVEIESSTESGTGIFARIPLDRAA